MATDKLKDTHQWLGVSGAVSVCMKCYLLRRTFGDDGRYPITEYVRVEGSSFRVHPKAEECPNSFGEALRSLVGKVS